MTNVQLAGSLAGSPRRFFAQLQDHPRYALALWLPLLASVALTCWYYGIVDLDWLKDVLISGNPSSRMSEEQREAANRFVTRGYLLTVGIIGVVVVTFVTRLLEALYYRVAGSRTGLRRTFRQWFAFATWTALPQLIGVVPAILILLFAGSPQISPGALQPLSLNELFFHRPYGAPGYNLLSILSVLHIVTLAFTVFGIRCWSTRSWRFSALFVLTPALVCGLAFAGYAALSR